MLFSMAFTVAQWLFFVFLLMSVALCEECPYRCTCQDVSSHWTKLRCGGPPKAVKHMTEIDLQGTTRRIVQLNLSFNNLSDFSAELYLPAVRKLDVSHNQISTLRNAAFDGLPELRQLDLSHNLLTTVRRETFQNLPSLKQM